MESLNSVLAVLAFYALFLVVGLLASRRGTRESSGADQLLLAGRKLPLLVGVLTMTATWVGGGYINGTAEAVFDSSRGLLWTQAPWCYALSLILGGLLFARRMRGLRLTTLLDLFERRYGKRVAALLYVPALLGEVFWGAAILAALGTAISTILAIPFVTSIWISTAVAVLYTLVGGLWAVAYTDVLQLACIAAGLCVALAYAMGDATTVGTLWEAYRSGHMETARWLPPAESFQGQSPWGWLWLDSALLLIFGGIPWQVYFQRVLACKDERSAMNLSILAGIGCLVMAVPAAMIGMVGATADWASVGVANAPDAPLVLPYVLKYLTSPWVGTIGLAAVIAAVMSSVDSSILSASSMFAWNVYRPILRPNAGDSETQWAMRAAICLVGTACALLAVRVNSVYALWILCADLVYVLLFPQLVCALYVKKTNAIGAMVGCATGFVLRVGGGEPLLGLESWIPYPWQTPDILFPFRTFAMVSNLATTLLVSRFFTDWRPSAGVQSLD